MINFVGGLVGVIFGIAGILNLINMMITTILTRRHEFAAMQSIGMTARQLCGRSLPVRNRGGGALRPYAHPESPWLYVAFYFPVHTGTCICRKRDLDDRICNRSGSGSKILQ